MHAGESGDADAVAQLASLSAQTMPPIAAYVYEGKGA